MAVTTYTVKRGDTLSKICSTYKSSIAGTTNWDRILTVSKLNNIKDQDQICVGQVLTFSESTGTSSPNTNKSTTTPMITSLGLKAKPISQSGGSGDRDVLVRWSFSRPNLGGFTVSWREFLFDGTPLHDEDVNIVYEQAEDCVAVRSCDAASAKVRVSVKPYSKTYKDSNGHDKYYWEDGKWSIARIYEFSNNPPSVPGVPNVSIDNDTLTLTASISNINAYEINASKIEFEVIKDNASKINSGISTVNTISNYVSYSCTVPAGGTYTVRCRAVRGTLTSAWSEFSGSVGTKPNAPTEITVIRSDEHTSSSTFYSIHLEWAEVSNATSYDIQYNSVGENYWDDSSQVSQSSTEGKTESWDSSGINTGYIWYFRVRAVNDYGYSDWSTVKSIAHGIKPEAPTTWSSTTTAVLGESIKLYWVHNANDGSSETYAQLELIVDGGVPQITNISNDASYEDRDKIKSYSLNVSGGAEIKWRIRTAGVTKVYGDWSIQRTINAYEKPTLELSLTNQNGVPIEALTEFPLYIRALAGPHAQTPIGYYVTIASNDYYETVDDAGRTKIVNNGDLVYSKYYDTSESLILALSAESVDFETGFSYTVTCSVTMNSGLSAEVSKEFSVNWTDVFYTINADVLIDEQIFSASIYPQCLEKTVDGEDRAVSGVTLSVYRREFDGTFTELAKGIDNAMGISITDPHPSLDYARYRVVAITNSTGAVSFYDLPGYPVNGKAVIIQWDEDWSTFDTDDVYSIEKPPWTGSMLKLEYNIDVSDNSKPDVSLIEYAGRSHPVSYYGTQLGQTSTWSMEIDKKDDETLYGLRRLARWTGDVYVREPSGSGYWANISVSFSQTHCKTTIPVTLDITRVEGGA